MNAMSYREYLRILVTLCFLSFDRGINRPINIRTHPSE